MSFFSQPAYILDRMRESATRAANLARVILEEHQRRIDCVRSLHNSTVTAIAGVCEMVQGLNRAARNSIYNHHTLSCGGCSSVEAETVAKSLVELQDEILFNAEQLCSAVQLSTAAWNANVTLLRNHPSKGISIERIEEFESVQANKVFAMIAEVYTFYPAIRKLVHIDSHYDLHLAEAIRQFTALRDCIERHIPPIDRHVQAMCDILASSAAHIRAVNTELAAESPSDAAASGAPAAAVFEGAGDEQAGHDGAEGEE